MFSVDYRRLAWGKLSGKWGKMAVIALVFLLITGAAASFDGNDKLQVNAGVSYSINLLSLLLGGPLTVGFYSITLRVLRDGEPDIAELFTPFGNYLNTFLLYFLNTLFTALWTLLLIVPGIVKMLSYNMSYFIMSESPTMSQGDARRASMKLMEGHKWELFCLYCSFIGWLLLSALTFGILLLWVIPYIYTAVAAFYENICLQNAIGDESPAFDSATDGAQSNSFFDQGL